MKVDGEFHEAVDNICAATRKFQALVGEEQGYVSDIEDQFAVRVPPGTYCLRMAYRVWNDILAKRTYEQRHGNHPQSSPGVMAMPMGVMPGMAPLIQLGPLRTQSFTPEWLASMFEGLDPQLLELAAIEMRRRATEQSSNDDGSVRG